MEVQIMDYTLELVMDVHHLQTRYFGAKVKTKAQQMSGKKYDHLIVQIQDWKNRFDVDSTAVPLSTRIP